MKARNSLVVSCRKKTEDREIVFFKAIAKYFLFYMEKLFMADLRSNGLHEKVMICYVIILYY